MYCINIDVKQGDILEEPADVLICSANVYLNLSGGVGGEILRRYGDAMQKDLHQYLKDNNLNFVERGAVIQTPGFETSFKHVLHAVAIDAFYETSSDIVTEVLTRSFEHAARLGAKKVAVTALGTGFGRLSMEDFSEGLFRALARDYPPLESACVVVPKREQLEAIQRNLAQRITD